QVVSFSGFPACGQELHRFVAYSFAVKFVGATVTSLIVASAPMFTAPLSAIYLDEDVNQRVAIGTILTIIGVIMVVVIF
ncbi:MAG: EamA family transporter, partial [Promethearchaeota archaeon]